MTLGTSPQSALARAQSALALLLSHHTRGRLRDGIVASLEKLVGAPVLVYGLRGTPTDAASLSLLSMSATAALDAETRARTLSLDALLLAALGQGAPDASGLAGATQAELGLPVQSAHWIERDQETLAFILILGELAGEPAAAASSQARAQQEVLTQGLLISTIGALLWDEQRLAVAQELSEHDGTTGLYNRRHLEHRLEEECSRAERHERSLGVIQLGIDNTALLKDSLGPDLFEAALMRIAGVLAGDEGKICPARGGDLPVYFGEGQFLLLLPDTSKKGAVIKADRVRDTVARLFSNPGPDGRLLRISVGVSAFPEDAVDADALLDGAQRALRAAQTSGGNRLAQV